MAGTTVRSSRLHMLGAFVLMGSWAAFANRHHPMPAPLIAGVVQGTMSACLTFVMKRIIEYFVARMPGAQALTYPPFLAVGVSILVLLSVHALVGTPEILPTIIVPVLVTAVYSISYTITLWRAR
ncbi:MAG: hypothetical protein DI498_02950 [Paracoccus denitrificans]|nr:MAG: hypothetical protein DI498_02950 [Paracoccus denitrificans]PZO85674.1 MAG: hypothetical protein DI633_02950 [Paracoccus denitrificans]